MSLYLKQSETRSQLQERLAKELQEKARQKASEAELPDGVEDSAYLQGTRRTASLAWVWFIIVIVAVGVVVWLLVATA